MSTLTSLGAGTYSGDTGSVSTTRTGRCPSLGAGKESFVQYLFDIISPRYDLFNRLSSLGLDQRWRRKAIVSLHLLPGMRVLDLASGTGDLSVKAARELVPLGSVVGCDLSYPMLFHARRKMQRIPFARWHVELTLGRAEALPFGSFTFDGITIGFALRNFSDLTTSFKELVRVLKKGGRIALLEFGRPENLLLRLGHRLWLATGVPLIGILTTGRLWPFLYLRRSIQEFLSQEQVVRELEGVGFSEVRAEPLNGGIVYLYQAVKS